MVIQLSPETEARIRELMERGGYAGPEAVVDEALRVLEERDQYAKLKAAIAVGIEQIERGEVVEWTPDLLDRLKRSAEERVRLGKPYKYEVIPQPSVASSLPPRRLTTSRRSSPTRSSPGVCGSETPTPSGC